MRNVFFSLLVSVSILVGCTPTGSPTAMSNDPAIVTRKYITSGDKIQVTTEARNSDAIEASLTYNGQTFTQVAKSGDTLEFPSVPNGTYEVTLTPRKNGVKGNSETFSVLVGTSSASPNPSPSASATPVGYSFSPVVTLTDRDKVSWRLDGAGYKSASLSYGGSLVSTNRGGTLSLSGFPSGGSDVVGRVTLDDGTVRTENVRVDLNYSGASPSPSALPVIDSPTVNPSIRSVMTRVGGTNLAELRLRIAGQDLLALPDRDLTVYGLLPNTRYDAEYWAKNSTGQTTTRSFSFSTTSEGGGGSVDKTVASYWRTAAENYNSAVNWSSRYWSLDTVSEGGLYIPLNDTYDYEVTITPSSGNSITKRYTNNFIEFRPLPSGIAPFSYSTVLKTSKNGISAETVIASGRIEKK